jgi:hypothetical protein
MPAQRHSPPLVSSQDGDILDHLPMHLKDYCRKVALRYSWQKKELTIDSR